MLSKRPFKTKSAVGCPDLAEDIPGSNYSSPEILHTAVLLHVTRRAIMKTKEPLNGIQVLHVATLSRR